MKKNTSSILCLNVVDWDLVEGESVEGAPGLPGVEGEDCPGGQGALPDKHPHHHHHQGTEPRLEQSH
jgi:hypothetical protein